MQTLNFPTIWDLPLKNTRKNRKAKAGVRYKERFLTIWDNPRPSRIKTVSSQPTLSELSS